MDIDEEVHGDETGIDYSECSLRQSLLCTQMVDNDQQCRSRGREDTLRVDIIRFIAHLPHPSI